MRRLLAIALILFLSIGLLACGNTKSSGTAVEFYYRTEKLGYGNEAGVISGEQRYIADINAITDILSAYFSGPENVALHSPFPNDLAVKSITLNSTSIELVLSDQIAELSGIDLTIACACIQKTITEITGINTVHISAENEMINNQDVIILKPSNILLIDTEISNPGHSESGR